MRRQIDNFDTRITRLVRQAPDWMGGVYRAFTTILHPATILALLAVVGAWAYSAHEINLALASLAVVGVIGINTILKLIFKRVRPATEYVEAMLIQTFSFPSGHAAASAVGIGFFAYLAAGLLASPLGVAIAALGGLFILMVGTSRVYLGAHYPSDVAAGWLVGLVGLLLIILVVQPLA